MSRRLEPLLRDQRGFTLIEGIVAALLVALVSLAVMTAFDTARRATFRSEQSQVATDRAQQELEAIRALGYESVALTSAPSGSSDENDPRFRVSGSDYALSRDGTDPQPLVIEGGALYDSGVVEGAAVDPGPTPFTSGDISGEIYRFVTWRDDPNCPALTCPGAQDLKRVVVAIAIDATAVGGTRGYVEVQSDVIDPEDSAIGDDDIPGLGDLIVAQQFWLSDERCVATGEPSRPDPVTEPLTSHAVRNTFGYNCDSGTAGRPDALLTSAPLNLLEDVDFANDLEPTPPEADAGIQFNVGGSNGCKFKPTGTNAYKESHLWVSEKLPQDFSMTGGATLELWTRAINDIETSGRICVTLFTRSEDPLEGLPPNDVRLADADNPGNLYFTGTINEWPAGAWQKIRIPMNFDPATALVGERVGVAIGLEKSGSPSDQLMFQYDHVDFDSRLEVETTTPLTS